MNLKTATALVDDLQYDNVSLYNDAMYAIETFTSTGNTLYDLKGQMLSEEKQLEYDQIWSHTVVATVDSVEEFSLDYAIHILKYYFSASEDAEIYLSEMRKVEQSGMNKDLFFVEILIVDDTVDFNAYE